jgi:SAND domain
VELREGDSQVAEGMFSLRLRTAKQKCVRVMVDVADKLFTPPDCARKGGHGSSKKWNNTIRAVGLFTTDGKR